MNVKTYKALSLGYEGVAAQFIKDNYSARLIIFNAAETDENGHTPASTASVYGKDALILLRDLLNEEFPVQAAE